MIAALSQHKRTHLFTLNTHPFHRSDWLFAVTNMPFLIHCAMLWNATTIAVASMRIPQGPPDTQRGYMSRSTAEWRPVSAQKAQLLRRLHSQSVERLAHGKDSWSSRHRRRRCCGHRDTRYRLLVLLLHSKLLNKTWSSAASSEATSSCCWIRPASQKTRSCCIQ